MVDITNKDKNKGCVITTGVSSLNYYQNYMQQFHKDNETVYNCMGTGSIHHIDTVGYYNIIIDLSDYNVKTTVFEIFNFLLPLQAELYVKLIKDDSLKDGDIYACIELLEKLEKNNLIKLKVINRNHQFPKEERKVSWLKKFKNLFFFIGPGNTGKTSIITALTELCNEKNKRVALVDLTEGCKLINYFSNLEYLSNSVLNHKDLQKNLQKKNMDFVATYRYSSQLLREERNLKYFHNIIKHLAENYDYVFINTDINVLKDSIELFKMGEKVFIVQDIMPTKINLTKDILLNFAEKGINKNYNIALIYNKIITSSLNLRTIEEKIIFKKSDNQKLIPLIDLNSKVFEIPYSKKTMKAIINNISTKSSIVYNASYSYKRNIEYIYKYINNISYIELEEMNVFEGLNYCLNEILQCYNLQKVYKRMERYIVSIKNALQSIFLLNTSSFIENK